MYLRWAVNGQQTCSGQRTVDGHWMAVDLRSVRAMVKQRGLGITGTKKQGIGATHGEGKRG